MTRSVHYPGHPPGDSLVRPRQRELCERHRTLARSLCWTIGAIFLKPLHRQDTQAITINDTTRSCGMLTVSTDRQRYAQTFTFLVLLMLLLPSLGVTTEARFDNYFLKDGLPGKTVWASHEDSLGFLWVGGTNGLARFDGNRFERFPFPESHGVFPANAIVRDFAISPDNTIWVGTLRHGAFRIDPYATQDRRSSIEKVATEGSRVRSLAVTRRGVFAGTSEGLEAWDSSTQRFRLVDIPELKTTVSEVFAATESLLLIGTSNGIYRYTVGSATAAPIASKSLGEQLVYSIGQVGKDVFLAGTAQGVFQFSLNGSSATRKPWVDQKSAVFSIAVSNGNVWLGTREGLVRIIDGELSQRFNHDPRLPGSISDSTVTSVAVDRSGVLWAGTFSGGLDRLYTAVLEFGWYDAGSPGFECLNESIVHSLLEIDDSLWIGTSSGLGIAERGSGQCVSVDTNGRGVLGLIQEPGGDIWAATTAGPAKVSQTDGSVTLEPPILNHLTYFVRNSGDGSLIAGTGDGLFRIDMQTKLATQVAIAGSSENQPGVYAATKANDGTFLLATDTGLYRWRPDSDASQVDLAGVRNGMQIRAITHAHSSLWLGSPDEGLIEVEDESYAAKVRLSADDIGEILGMIYDGTDLWITTGTGVVRFTPKSGTTRKYTASDGLQSDVFTEWAVMQGSNGHIYLGGRRGLNVFDPKDIQPNLVPPKVALTGLTLFNEPVPIGSSDEDLFSLPSSMELLDSLSLTHNQDTIGIEFAALHFADPSRNTIEYRLDGFEDKWSTARSGQRVATYTSLPWGDYTFRVRAANKDGVWGEEATLPITIITPVWARWWAIGAYIAFAFVLAWAYAQYRSAAANRRAQQLEATVNARTRELAERNQRVEEQKATIEHLLSRKNSLFANVSHEFRTPLTLILGPLDQLIEKAKNSSEQKPMFLRLRRNANRLLNLVDQLLFLARTTGSHYQTRETLRLDECVEYLVSSFQPLADEKNLQLTTTKCHAASVLANKDAVESMVSNLLSNAIKYTPAGGQIIVSLERLSDTVKLSVSDTGRGLSISEQATIFERFTRLDEDRSVEGTGIGLALVRELAEAHEGDIEVESVIGEGTTFSLILPLTAAAVPVQERTEAPAPDQEAPGSGTSIRQNVLIIDDDRDMLEYVAECLEQDFHCIIASNGREGLELALELVPDVIVSDVMMPEVDGYELSRAIREDERLSHIPIILLSARGSRKSRIEGWNAYADDYLVKPFDHNELRARIHSLLKVRELLRTKVHGELVEHGKPTGLNKKEQAFVDRLDVILERRYTEIGLSRADLASEMAVSDRQLQRKLKAIIDQNPSDYLREFRLRKAKGLLSQGEQVALAAEYCGFASPSQFGHAFKQRFGITPKKFQMSG